MKKLLFVGAEEVGFFAGEIAHYKGMDFDYVNTNGHITYQVNEILEHKNVTYLVFDVGQYLDSPVEIAEEIKSIINCNGAKAIIYAAGFIPQSDMVLTLYEQGFKEFILSSLVSEQKDQLEKCMNGYFEVNGMQELNTITLETQEEELKEKYSFKTIAVAGSVDRIGTTTQSMHIIKYLQINGYKACYVHMNSKDYIKNVKEYYNPDSIDEEMGKLVLEGIDHYYRIEKLSDVKKQGYDYYVYNYGTYGDKDFNLISFLEKDIKILVLGYKPMEMAYAEKVMQGILYEDVKYIFSFADEIPEEEIAELMGEKMQDTIIPKRCTEIYKLFEPEAYKKIIPVEAAAEEEKKKKKWTIFSRGRKNGKV